MVRWLKQSTAVDVLLGPFVDDTDGKTTEEALTLSQADLHLSKNGAASAQKNDATAATHRYGGNYMVDLDATDTNTLGQLRLMCKESGALPVIADFMVVPAESYDALIAGTDTLSADVTAISGDTTAADNLELMYDGTGYTDDTAPASRSQVGSISSAGGGSYNTEVSEDNTGGAIKSITFVGSQTGTFANTDAADGVYHQIDDTGNAIDIVYGVDVGGSGIANQVSFDGYLSSGNDQLNIFAYDFVGTTWDQIGTLTGQGGTGNVSDTYPLLSRHTGTGADSGKVYIRFQNTGQSNPTLYVDRLFVSAITSASSIGYEDGAVWVDTNASNTNTESFVDGTADNPVSTIAAARTIADNLNLKDFRVIPNSSFTLAQSYANYDFTGHNYQVALGGQDISGTYFFQSTGISGIGDVTNGNSFIVQECQVNTATVDSFGYFEKCSFTGTLTMNSTAGVSADGVMIANGFSGVAGSGSPTFDMSGVTKTTNLNVRHWQGGGTWTFNSNCTASIEVGMGGTHTITTGGGDIEFRATSVKQLTVTSSGSGTTNIVTSEVGTITINGTGGTVNIYGSHGDVVDNSSGAVTINDQGTKNHIADAIWDEALSGHTTAGSAGKALADIEVDTGTTLPATLAALNDISVADILGQQLSEVYATTGTAPTVQQALMFVNQVFSNYDITGTTLTVYGLDGTTPVATFTLNSATVPTSRTRS
jgi:hypothetical protein